MKTRILAFCQTGLRETDARFTQAETADESLRRDLEDQFIRTLLPSQDAMIPARRVYALLSSVTQAFSSHAYAVESALHERHAGPRDVSDTFFRFQEALHEMLESLPDSEVPPAVSEFSALNRLLDKWLHLTGTVDTDTARYHVWRRVTELVEDLDLKLQPTDQPSSTTPTSTPKHRLRLHLVASVYGNPFSTTSNSSHTRHIG